MSKHSVLFVCLGNICRSPIAEAIFRKLIADRKCGDNWIVDSAALGPWNLGDPPDPRGLRVMKQHGLDSKHRARLAEKEDFEKFEYILCMDGSNMRDLKTLAPGGSRAVLKLLGSYDSQGGDVIEDPYYGRDEDFEVVFQQCWRACGVFLDSIKD